MRASSDAAHEITDTAGAPSSETRNLPVLQSPLRRAVAAALLLTSVGAALALSPRRESPDHLTFELVERSVKQGYGTTILVRLVDERTGRAVPNATLFISRVDMSPHDMAMSASVEPAPDTLPGYFRFETDLPMGGAWALTLAAQVPGVPEPVQSRLILQAVP